MKQLRQHTARFAAIAIIFVLYSFSRLPALPDSERAALASSFSFASMTLPELPDYEYRVVRNVHPDLKRIESWLSAMGAAVALNDLDGDGLPNDVCHVDIRIDQLIISPAPGTPERYEPFALSHAGVRYDAETMAPVGCIPSDMNEDGRLDLLAYYWGRPPIAFLKSEMPARPPSFPPSGGDEGGAGYGVQDRDTATLSSDDYTPVEILADDSVWWSSGATFADFDGDGHADLLVTNYFPDETTLLGSPPLHPPQWGGKRGGDLINMQQGMARAFNGGGTHIFLWEGGSSGPDPNTPEGTRVRFRKVEGVFDETVKNAWTLAVGAADLDGDLLPEIYFANDYGPDRLLHNRSRPGELSFAVLNGPRFFTTPKSKALGNDSFKGMGVDFGDVNGDGLFDIFVSNIAADYALHESHFLFTSTGETARMKDGIAPYVDEGEQLGVSRSSWGWESRLADFNNDGLLEAVQSTGFMKGEVNRWAELQELGLGSDELLIFPGAWPRFSVGDDLNGHVHNPFYVRSASGRYYDLAPDLGLDQLQTSRGIATADVDGDGDLDFAVANQWEVSRFYRNDCPNCADFLGLHLLLPLQNASAPADITRAGHPGPDTPGRAAIGALAKVMLPDGRQLVGMVDGGNGQSGVRSSDIHFGLGQLDPAIELTVELHWRDNRGQIRQETLQLAPGWHTILLDQAGQPE